jgi:hypothetical protein
MTTLSYVYDGQTALGHLIHRGRLGWESFNRDDKSLGTFATMKAAADAVFDAATEKGGSVIIVMLAAVLAAGLTAEAVAFSGGVSHVVTHPASTTAGGYHRSSNSYSAFCAGAM